MMFVGERMIADVFAPCCSCGESHEDVSMKPLVRSIMGYTHWFSCPITGDPVHAKATEEDEQTVKQRNEEIWRYTAEKLQPSPDSEAGRN